MPGERERGRWTLSPSRRIMASCPASNPEEDAAMSMKPLALAAVLLAALLTHAEPAKDAPKETKLFDGKTLKGWKEADFYGKGKAHVKDGAVILEKGKQMTGITYAGKDFPKTD